MRLFVFISLFSIVFSAYGQNLDKHDTAKPIEIASDSLEVRQKEKIAIFKGNVIATQGNIKLRSETMQVYYRDKGNSPSAISKIEVDGKVFLATPQETAKGDKGIYEVDKKEITLLGNVVLTREKNVLKGSRLQYNLASGKSVITGGGIAQDGKGGRVRGLFVPEDNKK